MRVLLRVLVTNALLEWNCLHLLCGERLGKILGRNAVRGTVPGHKQLNPLQGVPRKCPGIRRGTKTVQKMFVHYGSGDFWDGTQCVQRCPETSDDIVCEACADMDQSNPVWDPIAQICRPCTAADGGALWDSVARRCVATCPNTAPKVTFWHVCRPCNEWQDKGRFWDGEDCVAECSLAWDENMVYKSCMELDLERPFWSGSECVAKCSGEKPLASVDDTRYVADCSGMTDVTV